MKKIAILATYVGVINRGAETFVIELLPYLREKFQVDIFSMGEIDNLDITKVKFVEPKLLKYYRTVYNKFFKIIPKFISKRIDWFSPDIIFQYLFSQKVFKHFIRNRKYDLIFVNNGISGAFVSWLYRKKTGTPFVLVEHGGIGGMLSITRLEPLLKPDRIVTLTERDFLFLKKRYGRAVKINNGVNIDKFNNKYQIFKEHVGLKHPIVLCVAAFVPFKRQSLLINAMGKLGNGTLILLGEGPEKDRLMQLASKYKKIKIIFDHVMYQQIPYYYWLCDIFSLPSQKEPFGIVYLEAMSANKPIVAPDDETRQEIVGNAGILCNVENAISYSEMIKKCYNQDWGSIPRERVKKLFSWDVISNKYIELFKELLEDG